MSPKVDNPERRGRTARSIAAETLNRIDPKCDYAGPVLNQLLGQTNQKQRATDLVLGTLRNADAVDAVIARFADCPVGRIPAGLRNIIRIASFELIYSPDTPAYSIVNEAVENAKSVGGKRQTGFVNAVLRQIQRHIASRRAPLTGADPTRTIPQSPSTGCEFDIGFLPEPKVAPAEYLSAVFSLPQWLVNDWLGEFGFEEARRICLASNRRPSIYISPNTLKTTTRELAETLRKAGVNFEIEPEGSMIRLESAGPVRQLPGFADGLFTVQDKTASQAVGILNPEADWNVLDLCAAPGTKTIQLAQVTGDAARITATDIDASRLEKVKENVARFAMNSVRVVPYENLQQQVCETGLFDAVLLDVPCSNTGVLARRVEVRHRISQQAIMGLTKRQTALLAGSAPMLRPGGKICYTTCSIQKRENSAVVSRFLQENPDFELEFEKLMLPSAEYFDHDGGYVAVMRGK